LAGFVVDAPVTQVDERRFRVLMQGAAVAVRTAEEEPVLYGEAGGVAATVRVQTMGDGDLRVQASADVGWLQVESDAADCELPVVLYVEALSLSGTAWKRAARFESLEARVAQLRANIEDETMELWARFFSPLLASVVAATAKTSRRADGAVTDAHRWLCVIDNLSLGALDVVVSVKTQRTLPMLVTMRDSRLFFWPVQARRVRCTWAHLKSELAANYLADLVLSAPGLLGSLDILGNPTGLVRQVAAGLHDLVALPLEELKHGWGPGAVVRGVARGWLGLLSHVAEGTLASLSGFSGAVARNLDRLATERQSDATVMRQVVRGVVGVAVLPLGGVADLVERAAGGLMYSAGMVRERKRLPRDNAASSPHAEVDLERLFNWKMLGDERCLVWARAWVQVVQIDSPVTREGWVLCTTRGVRAVELCAMHDEECEDPPPTRFLCEWAAVGAMQESLVDGVSVAMVLGGEAVKLRFRDAKQRRAFVQCVLARTRSSLATV